jgi:TIR domain
MAHVFVSHRNSDDVPAEKLAEELRRAGHQVWFDKWEVNVGDSVVGRMNEGLEGAAYVVLCYSSSGVASPYTLREWLSALARQLGGRPVKILPVILTGDLPPAILADIKPADLARDWDEGVRQLLRAIR